MIENQTTATGEVQTLINRKLGRLDVASFLCGAAANQMIQDKDAPRTPSAGSNE